LNGLRDYHKKYDKKSKTYMPEPDPHQWSRHPADGFRTFAVGYQKEVDFDESDNQVRFKSRKY